MALGNLASIFDRKPTLTFIGGRGNDPNPGQCVWVHDDGVDDNDWTAKVEADGTEAALNASMDADGAAFIAIAPPGIAFVRTDDTHGYITSSANAFDDITPGMCAYVEAVANGDPHVTTGFWEILAVTDVGGTNATIELHIDCDATGDGDEMVILQIGGSWYTGDGTSYDSMFAGMDASAFNVHVYSNCEEDPTGTIDATGGTLDGNTFMRLYAFKTMLGDMGFSDPAVRAKGDVAPIYAPTAADAYAEVNGITKLNNPNAQWVTLDSDGGAFHQWTLDDDDNISLKGFHFTGVATGTRDLFSTANTPLNTYWGNCIFSSARNGLNASFGVLNECYFDDSLLHSAYSITGSIRTHITSCIVKIRATGTGMLASYGCTVFNCLFIGGGIGIFDGGINNTIVNTTFVGQTITAIYINAANACPRIYNNILQLVAVNDEAVFLLHGSIGYCDHNVAFCAAGDFDFGGGDTAPFYDSQTDRDISGPNDQVNVNPGLVGLDTGWPYPLKRLKGKPDIRGRRSQMGAMLLDVDQHLGDYRMRYRHKRTWDY